MGCAMLLDYEDAAKQLMVWERVRLLRFGEIPILARVGAATHVGSVSKLPGGLVHVQLSPTQLPSELEAVLQKIDEDRLTAELPASIAFQGYQGNYPECIFARQKYAVGVA